MRRAALLVAWLVVMLVGVAPQLSEAQESFGRFKGELSVTILQDGRNVRVAAPFGFIDPNGKHWDMPVGTVATQSSWPAALTRRFPPLVWARTQSQSIPDNTDADVSLSLARQSDSGLSLYGDSGERYGRPSRRDVPGSPCG